MKQFEPPLPPIEACVLELCGFVRQHIVDVRSDPDAPGGIIVDLANEFLDLTQVMTFKVPGTHSPRCGLPFCEPCLMCRFKKSGGKL